MAEHDVDMAAVKGEHLEVTSLPTLGASLFSLAWLGVCHREPGLEPCDGEVPAPGGGGVEV